MRIPTKSPGHSEMMSPGFPTSDNHHPAATAKMAILIVAAFPSRLSRYTRPQSSRNEQLHTAECSQEAGVTTVTTGEREVGEELGNALVKDGTVVATGFVPER